MENSQWFESWFDTKYYHILYKKRDHKEAERFIGNLVDYLKIPQGSHILDLACGKGRHAITFYTHGYNVLGVDLSAQSIEFAKGFENEHLKFKVHDMREPIVDVQFDAVFNLFTSFGYFDSAEDNGKVLHSISKYLKPDGVLLIDFMNAKKTIDNLVEKEIVEIDGITFNITRNFDNQHIFKHINFFADEKEHRYMERVQALTLVDFEVLLSQHGFDLIRTFGDFNLNPFDENTSDRLILLAKKNNGN